METPLASRECAPTRKDSQPLTDEEIQVLLAQLPDWNLIRDGDVEKLHRSYDLKNFRQALTLAERVGALAEEADHHPMLVVEWGKLGVTWWTHVIGGLFINDFIMAARTDEAYEALRAS